MAYSANDAIEAIQGSKGFIKTIADKMGCTRQTVYNLIERYPTVKTAIEEERENFKDFAESKLAEEIENNNLGAIIFYLKTQGRARGYIEKQELEQSGAIEINVTYDRTDTR